MNHSLALMDYLREETEDAKQHNKAKLHKLLDKYGSVEEIEDNAVGVDEYEYMFANVNNLIDEVLEERRTGNYNSLKSSSKIEKASINNPSDDSDDIPEEIKRTKREAENMNKLSPLDHLRAIRALRNRLNPEDFADTTQKELKHADNKYAGVKSDGNYERDNRKETHYAKYGKGFPKNFIDELESDIEFHKIIQEYLKPNEGEYNNDPDDNGGETNWGISQKTHSNEDIKNMTRERADAIFYRDYYKWSGIYKLPYKIRGFIVDFGVVSYPEMAIKMTHRVLGIPEGNIIGKNTLEKFKNFTQKDYENFLKKYQSEMITYFYKVVEAKPKNKKFLAGWLNRAKRAHLAD